MKIKLFLYILLFIPLTNAQYKTTKLSSQIDTILKDTLFNKTIAAVEVYNLSTQTILYKKNNTYLLRPASNLKLFTTAAGLLFLGQDYKFNTKAYYTGQILNNTLYGDVYIKGGFDPFFKLKI